MFHAVILMTVLLPLVNSDINPRYDNTFLYDTFNEGFIWATATSSYQIEGAWNEDGKGVNIWDTFCHEGGNIEGDDTGDVACDSYHKYMDDVALVKDLQVDSYRFSISWSRLLPDGTLAGGVNEPGVAYYNKLINALLAVDIKPMVTLYHWDLPQPLQDIGGWENEELVQHFTDYANLCFQRFGDRVPYWITFNEPWVVAWLGYGVGAFAPGVNDPGSAAYKAGHTMLKAHAESWHLYNDQYRELQGGLISITLNAGWSEPKTNKTEDLDASERSVQFNLGWFGEPIFGDGDYPDVMRERVDAKSQQQGFNESRLPAFTEDEMDRIRGTHDFFGLNHYSSSLVWNLVKDISCVSYECDQDVGGEFDPSWPTSGSDWLRMVPWGLRSLLRWIKKTYGDVPILITENGFSDRNSSIQDTHRVNYYTAYINEALKANKTDNVNLIGYTAWSLMDNFEWGTGYHEKFGIHYVDFDDPDRPRKPKQSATAYCRIVQNNGFIKPSTPPPSTGQKLVPHAFMWIGLVVVWIITTTTL